ncbi:alkaline phosphatase family protein, partial [Aegicerativicinus sediminis]
MKLNIGLSKKLLFTLCCILSIFTFNSFTGSDKFETTFENSPIIGNKPKLVVGIVVDQMRYDYLTRFYSRYGQGGFKRLLDNGFNCKNNHFNYIPTYTGPGHSSVYTGTTPKYHGIISNSWYDKEAKTVVYCASDDSVATVGSTTNAGKMSPHRMKTNS